LIIIFIISCIGNVLLIILNLIIDVLRPKLEWTNPQEAVKQNMNGLFGMIATIIMLGIMAVIAIALIMLNLPDWLVYSALGAIMSALSVPGIIGLYALAEYRYRNIEV
jgi:ABC-2 type transport system permease protein